MNDNISRDLDLDRKDPRSDCHDAWMRDTESVEAAPTSPMEGLSSDTATKPPRAFLSSMDTSPRQRTDGGVPDESNLSGRTQKRFRDGRPSEKIIHGILRN